MINKIIIGAKNKSKIFTFGNVIFSYLIDIDKKIENTTANISQLIIMSCRILFESENKYFINVLHLFDLQHLKMF